MGLALRQLGAYEPGKSSSPFNLNHYFCRPDCNNRKSIRGHKYQFWRTSYLPKFSNITVEGSLHGCIMFGGQAKKKKRLAYGIVQRVKSIRHKLKPSSESTEYSQIFLNKQTQPPSKTSFIVNLSCFLTRFFILSFPPYPH